MIPKIIHAIWVGNAPKPALVEHCIASRTTFCPDYKVVEWGNAQLADVDNAYVNEAAAEGKWAFVSDYLRLKALYEMGGFYMDSDLEVTASIDRFRTYDFVTGFEQTLDGKRVRPVTALLGAKPHNPIIGSLLKEYDDLHFMKDGVPDLTTNTDRISRNFRRNHGLAKSSFGKGEKAIYLDDNSVIFPYFFFCTPKPGEENYAIHHFIGSWVPAGNRKVVATFGKWMLLKFTFQEGEDATVPLENGEKLIWHVSSGAKKKRALALVRRTAP